MFTSVKSANTDIAKSDFLVKSTLGVSIASLLILLPFGLNNFVQARTLDGIITMAVILVFGVNAYFSWRGRYLLYLNLFGVVPGFTLGAVNAIVNLQVIGSYWSYLCAYAIYFILPFQQAKYTNAVFVSAVITAAWFSLDYSVFLRFSVVLIGTSIFIFISNNEITKTQNRLKKQAFTDSLTGVFNRVQMPFCLEEAIEKNREKGIASTICLIDIDNFKTINDTYGHDAGDKVLMALSRCILSIIDTGDTLFRIGGEEFLILLKDRNAEDGGKTAESVRAAVAKLPILKNHPVTISVGVSEVQTDYTYREWMKLTDDKLYAAKRNGRNKVVS